MHNIKAKRGALLIVSILFFTFYLWSLSKFNVWGSFKRSPLLSISQIFGLWGIVLMSLSLLLSTRLSPIEKLFGGLDKVYKIHIFIGSFAFVFCLAHPALLALMALPNTVVARLYLFPGSEISYNYGIFALYTIISSFLFIAFIKLPYNIWKYTHKFLGVAFLLAGMHALNIGSDVSGYAPLKFWISSFILIGLISFLYTLFFYKNYGPRYLYKVANVYQDGNVLNIEMRSLNKKLKFRPGQFAYFSFINGAVSEESHPFSFSSGPNDPMLRISPKMLGDFTNKMKDIKKDTLVAVYGPYGSFGDFFLDPKFSKIVWIAGGIGVTPFISMLRAEVENPSNKSFHFYYSVRSKKDAVFDKEIKSLCSKIRNVSYTLWVSNVQNLLTVSQIKEQVPDLKGCGFQICGPDNMRENLIKQFLVTGILPENIRSEDFSLI